MGNRLSKQRGVDGMSEAPFSLPKKRSINPRLLTTPIAAFTMAALVVLYTRSSIRAAKLNVEKRREQGGGQIDWGLESQRNHGVVERIDTAKINKDAIMGKALKENRKDGET